MRIAKRALAKGCARLAARIDQKLAALAAADPGLRDRVRQQARQRAVAALGLTALQAEWDLLTQQRQELDRRTRHLARAMLAVVRRVPLADVPVPDRVGLPAEVTQALQQCQAAHEPEVLAAEALGPEILRLQQEKAALAETVWLAVAPGPLQQLWQRVSALVGTAPTPLQQKTLAPRDPEAGT